MGSLLTPRSPGSIPHRWYLSWGLLVTMCIICGLVGFHYGLEIKGSVTQAEAETESTSELSWGKFTWTERCTDTCFKARDGVCDEGRGVGSGKSHPVFCDFGTDCTDCGAYEGPVMDEVWPGGGPVAYLTHTMKIKLFTRKTVTQPSFQMLYTDPKADTDVSHYLDVNGMIEGGLTSIFKIVLEGQCVSSKGHRHLVLDVGSNFGFFSVYSALLGCKVIAWEPVPHFRAFIAYNLAINNVTDLVTVRDKVVSTVDGQAMSVSVPTTDAIWGTASVAGINNFPTIGYTTVKTHTERVDSVVRDDDDDDDDDDVKIKLMKVDVEGFESEVMLSAGRLLGDNNRVENIILEYNPGVAERTPYTSQNFTHLLAANPRMLMNLVNSGYHIGLLLDHYSKGHLFSKDDMPWLPQVTAEQLRYDIRDMSQYPWTAVTRKPSFLSCTNLLLPNPHAECDIFPEDAHPKSLRSFFIYNTNLWATRSKTHIKLNGETAAVFQPHENARTQWSSSAFTAVGSRDCRHVPADDLVRNRYADPTEVPSRTASDLALCRLEHALVMEYMKRGLMTFDDYEHPKGVAPVFNAHTQ